MKKINIYEYTNFRDYLKAFFEKSKNENPDFSHRYLARKLGLATPNLILLVMQGKRNLTRTLSFKIARFFRLTKRENIYFDSMISFLQAKSHDEKNKYFESMTEIRRKVFAARIDEWQYEYYKNWYNPVIRELAIDPDFKGDEKWIAKRLSPSVTAIKVKRSIKLLLRLRLLRKMGRRYVQSNPIVSTGPEVNSLGIVDFHRKTCQLAAESFDRYRRNERSITSCTISIDDVRFQKLKLEIADLRKIALLSAQKPNKKTRVYQFNFQLFPVSKIVK
jgi:uncharacterized protein (TIGR02147 family)